MSLQKKIARGQCELAAIPADFYHIHLQFLYQRRIHNLLTYITKIVEYLDFRQVVPHTKFCAEVFLHFPLWQQAHHNKHHVKHSHRQ